MPKETLTEDDDDDKDLDAGKGGEAEGKEKPNGKAAPGTKDEDADEVATEAAEGGALIELSEEFAEDGGDERLQADRVAETVEQRQERRRVERKEAKVRQKRAKERREKENSALTARNAELERQVQELASQTNGQFAKLNERQLRADLSTIQGRKAQAEADAKEAGRIYAQAITKGDHETAAEAMELRDTKRDEAKGWSARERQYAEALKDGGAPDARGNGNGRAAAPKVSAATVKHAQAFMTKHTWYGPGATTPADKLDSGVITAIDTYVKDVLKLNSDTTEYWEKLEEISAERLPHRFDGADEDDDTDEDDEPAPRRAAKSSVKAPARRGPPATGGAIRVDSKTGKKQAFMSDERIAAMKESGHWDDPKKRETMIKRYLKHDQEQAGSAR